MYKQCTSRQKNKRETYNKVMRRGGCKEEFRETTGEEETVPNLKFADEQISFYIVLFYFDLFRFVSIFFGFSRFVSICFLSLFSVSFQFVTFRFDLFRSVLFRFCFDLFNFNSLYGLICMNCFYRVFTPYNFHYIFSGSSADDFRYSNYWARNHLLRIRNSCIFIMSSSVYCSWNQSVH